MIQLNKDDKKALKMLLIPIVAMITLPLFAGVSSLIAATMGLAIIPALALVSVTTIIITAVMTFTNMGMGPWYMWTLVVPFQGQVYTFTFALWQWSIIAVLLGAGGAA